MTVLAPFSCVTSEGHIIQPFRCPFFSVILSIPFKVEFREDMFWALFTVYFNSRLTSRAQLSLTRAQNIIIYALLFY